MPATTPPLVPQPFAQGGSKNSIPNTTADIQRASFALGFPPATMQPIDAGGVPMLGPDMNGILFDICAWLFALQGGQIQPYRADVSGAIAGYALGALVLMADGAGYWLSTTSGNVTDPDAGGAGWQPLYAYGAGDISGLVGGSRTLSAVEASRYFLVMTGVLLANQQIIVPNAYRNYLIVNATTGAFTLTVQTVAGTGVIVPQGGAASPSAVWCDTVNVNPVFVPSALPTSVAPTADSIVLRDNTGRQFSLTAPVGTRTTQVASTLFVNPGSLLATDGYRQFPDGTMVQWGQAAGAGSNHTVTFPTPFATAPYSVTLTPRITSGDALGQVPTLVGSPVAASFVFAPSDSSVGTHWTAWGRWSP
jgi:hypothetical protein